jgi:hypothetical protein
MLRSPHASVDWRATSQQRQAGVSSSRKRLGHGDLHRRHTDRPALGRRAQPHGLPLQTPTAAVRDPDSCTSDIRESVIPAQSFQIAVHIPYKHIPKLALSETSYGEKTLTHAMDSNQAGTTAQARDTPSRCVAVTNGGTAGNSAWPLYSGGGGESSEKIGCPTSPSHPSPCSPGACLRCRKGV